MAYSNGYNLTTVLPALYGRLAWDSGSDLGSTNTTSTSGRRFDDGSFHSVVTVPNVKAVNPAPAAWPAWFTAKQNAVIAKTLQSVFTKTEFFEQAFLFTKCTSEVEESVTNTGKAVGYKITLPKKFDVTAKLNSLQVYFNEDVTFNVYLFKQGSATAIKTKSVTAAANVKTTVTLTDWLLNYSESSVYYVVYFQDDLGTAKAIRENAVQEELCMMRADSFIADTTGSVFNRTQISKVSQPYGLNMQVSVFRDFTQHILNQPHLFDELIGLTMAAQIIEDILYSVTSSASERILKEQFQSIGLQLDLKGSAPISDGPKTMGIVQKIEIEAKRVKQAFYPSSKSVVVNVAH